MKADHRMNRCYRKGALGDSLLAVLCAAGFNIRWLLRMIAKKGIGLFLPLLPVADLEKLALQLRQIFVSKPVRPGSMNWAMA